jgi:hypothetical protein
MKDSTRRILLVEDNDNDAFLTKRALEAADNAANKTSF